ncbi:hypothetical protein [Polluticaenibacter yanchengensis]|uniref:Uncharacterized protein n=1 Tax=Polluticaenibacter yanchengensis TaxID=3014562 RepID=A0ABT4UPW5_9BACT|nr:hypothetical protein [Chitinophagaceae bacterium LY-5]
MIKYLMIIIAFFLNIVYLKAQVQELKMDSVYTDKDSVKITLKIVSCKPVTLPLDFYWSGINSKYAFFQVELEELNNNIYIDKFRNSIFSADIFDIDEYNNFLERQYSFSLGNLIEKNILYRIRVIIYYNKKNKDIPTKKTEWKYFRVI